MSDLPFSDSIRLNQIGAGVSRTLSPDADARRRIARALDLQALDAFEADLTLAPHAAGWRLDGRLRAEAVQTCGLTLDPLPASIDQRFSVEMVEANEAVEDSDEIEISLDEADGPDLIEDGKIDLGQYAVEQLALALDPFPRKPGAEFVQPPEPVEISPFAVLKAFKSPDDGESQG